MNTLLILFAAICIIIFSAKVIFGKQPRKKQEADNYHRVRLLTRTEFRFYQELIAVLPDSVVVLLKVRLADLIMPKKRIANWRAAFGKVCAKHIDFAIIDRQSARVICLIELDDKSHNRPDRIERDIFVNNICAHSNYDLIHIIVNKSYTADLQLVLERIYLKIKKE